MLAGRPSGDSQAWERQGKDFTHGRVEAQLSAVGQSTGEGGRSAGRPDPDKSACGGGAGRQGSRGRKPASMLRGKSLPCMCFCRRDFVGAN